MSYIAIGAGLFSIACGMHVLINKGKRSREAFLCRFMPESWLYENSLWDECDGEPMNAAADELHRRDCLAVLLHERSKQ